MEKHFKAFRPLVDGFFPKDFMVGMDLTERRNEMNLYNLMKMVDDMTKVRIVAWEEEMALTPHRLAKYGQLEVNRLMVNCQGELEVELSEPN